MCHYDAMRCYDASKMRHASWKRTPSVYDLSAAFDTVSHQTLIDKLTIYGFDQDSITWMKSYLHNRNQVVNVQGKMSSSQEMPLGTPQGSRISPLLFICLMADLDLWTDKDPFISYLDTFARQSRSRDIITDVRPLIGWEEKQRPIRAHPAA